MNTNVRNVKKQTQNKQTNIEPPKISPLLKKKKKGNKGNPPAK